jgi:hypothetical protein
MDVLTVILIVLLFAASVGGLYLKFDNRALRSSNRVLSEKLEDTMSTMLGMAPAAEVVMELEASTAALKSATEEMERRKESHERVVGVLIKERDRWQDMYYAFDRGYDGTVQFYDAKLAELNALLARELKKTDKAEMSRRIATVHEIRAKAKAIPVSKVVVGADGASDLERQA